MRGSIVIVEDDADMARLTSMLLEAEEFVCHIAEEGEKAADLVREVNPCLVLLDLMLPGKSGLEVCKELRQFYRGAILILTGQDNDITEVALLKAGADDYILKPIKPHTLLARIDAVLRRMPELNNSEPNQLEVSNLIISPHTRQVSLVEGGEVALTSAEFDILLLLAENAGEIVTREQCSERLRGIAYDSYDRSTDMRISSLRKKLSAACSDRSYIVTIRNKGYMLSME